MRIFNITSPLSKYLQTVGIDLLKAHQFVMGTLTQMIPIQRDYDGAKCQANKFIKYATDELKKHAERAEEPILIQQHFPEKKIRKKTKMPGGTC